MDGFIIECRYVDHKWVFDRIRNDRIRPNGLKTIEGMRTKLIIVRIAIPIYHNKYLIIYFSPIEKIIGKMNDMRYSVKFEDLLAVCLSN